MGMLHNRAVAVLVALLVVVASSVFGAGLTLGQMRAQTQAVFTLGAGGVPGIQSDLAEISAQAFNMTQIAGRYLQPDYAGVVRVLESRDALQRADTPREMRRATEEILGSTNALRNTLEHLDLSEQDQNLLAMVAIDINSRATLISQNPYNAAAHNFNQTLERFPANIFGRAVGIRPLELFE